MAAAGRTFYTHISDQYAPFHTKVVNVGVRDSTYVLDGLLYHESDLRIEGTTPTRRASPITSSP
jgi:TnpA family transposase